MELREGTPQEAGLNPERVELIRRRGREWVERGIHQCLVLLVARRGMVVLQEAYGRIYPEPDAPVTLLDTIFPLSSISKPLTATCLMILVEHGLVGLNRPVQEYIPEFVGAGKEHVMVHHLLTHTSGWDDQLLDAHVEETRGKVSLPPCPSTQHPAIHEELYLKLAFPLSRAPGSEMSYSSTGYNLLGEIVRRVSGRSLNDFAHDRIFE